MPTPLSWPDCRNVRDLGGLPTLDGGRIRDNALIRADSLARLTADGVEQLRKANVARIIDLRSVEEAQSNVHPFAEDSSLYRLVPLIDPAREPDRNKSAERTLADIYMSSLVRNVKSIVEGVTAVAEAPDGTVVVHCWAGKDRTGMIVGLALSVAGVGDEVIAEDYAYTEECLREHHESILADITDEAVRRKAIDRMSSYPQTMLSMLSFARERFGGVPEYLTAHGMPAELVRRLRDRLRDTE